MNNIISICMRQVARGPELHENDNDNDDDNVVRSA